jgi:hypothetical protein
MSQVAKSASAFVRAFLAILVLELEDMGSDWFARPNSPAFMAIVDSSLSRPEDEPRAAKELIGILKEDRSNQYIIATHNPEVVVSADPERYLMLRFQCNASARSMFNRSLLAKNFGVGGRSISGRRSPADRPNFHSGIFFSPTDVSGLRNPIVSWSSTVSRKKRLLHLILTDRRKAMSDKPRRLQQEIG